MTVKYVKDFSFDKSFGYSGSTGTGPVSSKEQTIVPSVKAGAKMGAGSASNANANRAAQAIANANRTPKPQGDSVINKKPRVVDDTLPSASELDRMRQAREYMREDKATSDAAKREMGFKKGGDVKADLKQDKKMIAESVHKHEKAQHPGKPLTKLKKGGGVMEKATGERYPSKSAMMKHEKTETPRMQREEMVQKRVVRGPAMAAGRDPRIPMLMCGGKVKK